MLAGLERIVATRLADDQPGRSNIIRHDAGHGGSFDISHASPFRRDGEHGPSVRLPLEAPSDARLWPLRSATFARPSSGDLAGRLQPDRRGVVE